MTAYYCPACRTLANLDTGCPACGRPSDEDDARLAGLDSEIATLVTRIEAARATYSEATQAWQGKQAERVALVAAIQHRRAGQAQAAMAGQAQATTGQAAGTEAGPAAIGQPAGSPAMGQAAMGQPVPGQPAVPAWPAKPRLGTPDAAPRTVQNLLFILGAVLVVVGAIAFKVFAWSTIGVAGRASILGGATVVALAIPVLAARRHLAATAETFAAIGLAFLFIDGFGVWSLNLFGVADAVPGARYTGIVFAVVAVAALAYSGATRLVGPRFIAILAVQPVLVLVASPVISTPPALSAIFAATSVLDLLIVVWLRRSASTGVIIGQRVLAWVTVVGTLLIATLVGLVALVIPAKTLPAVWGGLAMILAGLVLLAAGYLTGIAVLRGITGGIAAVEFTAAITRLGTVAFPGNGLVVVAVVTALLSAAVMVLPERLWPKIGLRIGMYAVAGVLGLVLLVRTLIGTGMYLQAIPPAWHTSLGSLANQSLDGGWRTTVAIPLLAVALALLLPRGRLGAVIPLAVLLAMSVPASLRLAWWAPSIVDGAIVLPLALFAVRTRRDIAAAGAAAATAVLAVHASVFSLPRPVTTAATLFGAAALGAAIAAMGRSAAVTAGGHASEPVRRAIAGSGLAVALVALPGAVVATVAVHTTHSVVVPRAEMATVLACALALAVLRRWWADLRRYAVVAVTLSALAAGVTPLIAHRGDPAALYAALGLLIITVVPTIAGVPGTARFTTVWAGILLVPVIAWRALPAARTVLFLPYAWLSSTWSGVPSGVGLSPNDDWHLSTVDAETLVLLALALAAIGAIRSRWAALATGAVPAAVATLAVLAAAGAAWPAVPVVSLLIGAAAVLYAALASGHRPARINAAIAGVATLGAGLAGSLPTKTSTLAGLGAALVVMVVTGSAGRATGTRVAGWLGAVATGSTLAIATVLAADVRTGYAAFGVSAVAAAAVFTAAAFHSRQRRQAEARALAGAGHAAAFVALTLTGSWHNAAIVSAAWGVVVGIRALWPGLATNRRWTHAGVAAGLEVLAWWFLLAARGVATVDAYTLPLAAVALLAGWIALRSRPDLGSWVGYGPALAAGFLPSLAPLLAADASVGRRLIVGVAALVTVLIGAWARLQAPVVIGGLALLAVAVHELVLLWQQLPTWIPLSVAGLVVLLVAVTYERRRRDMSRLRHVIARMT